LGTFVELKIATVVSDCHMENIQPVDAKWYEFDNTDLKSLLAINVQRMEEHDKNDS
jgi:hypothetical protein